MYRKVIVVTLLLIGLAAIGGLAIAIALRRAAVVTSQAAPLAAYLPPQSDADFAAAMPVIDELRQHRGSVVEGTLLEQGAENDTPNSSYVELLRREARRLDELAADLEDQDQWQAADAHRLEAHQLRQQARKIRGESRVGDPIANRPAPEIPLRPR